MAEVKIGIQPAASVFTPSSSYVNLFVDADDDKVKVKDSTGALTSLGSSATPHPADAITADQVAAIAGSSTPLTATNAVVSAAELAAATAPAGLLMSLSKDPSAGTGVVAAAPKLGIRLASGTTELWVKIGPAATAWYRLYPPCPTP